MLFKEENVNFHDIDANDHSYCITTENNIEQLADSIQTIGLLHRPLLTKQDNTYCIVSGFRRISALKLLGYGKIDAVVISNSKTNIEIAKIAITENSFQRQLNIIEKARAIKLLSTYVDNVYQIVQKAKSVNIQCDTDLINKLLKIYTLPVYVQDGLVNGYISLPVALFLDSLDNQSVKLFTEIFSTLHLSLNKQRELISLVSEISQRDGITIKQILKNILNELINDDALDHQRKIHLIRNRLRRIRFPELSETEENFKENMKHLSLGKGIRLLPPVHFEGLEYTFQLTFKNKPEIESILLNLNRIIHDPVFVKTLNR